MQLIVAVDRNWGIGREGALLRPIREDLRRFRRMTAGKVVVMGRTTLASLPGGLPLDNRINLVLTANPDFKMKNTMPQHSLPALLQTLAAYRPENVFVIGGGSVYRQLLDYCSSAYLTRLHAAFPADCHFPDIDALENWRLCEESSPMQDGELSYSFLTYENAAPKPNPYRTQGGSLVGDALLALAEKPFAEFRVPVFTGDRKSEEDCYLTEMLALLDAYFHPLAQGLSRADVTDYFQGGDASLYDYLIRKRRIAATPTLERLFETYAAAAGCAFQAHAVVPASEFAAFQTFVRDTWSIERLIVESPWIKR